MAGSVTWQSWGATLPHIARAVAQLRQDFDQPLRIERLARELGMSVSGLRQHFKAVTAMSPSQFQKQLRLQEARRLMLGEDLDAASAAYRVGYQDASHFNREYKSLFGVPPMHDVQRLIQRTRHLVTITCLKASRNMLLIDLHSQADTSIHGNRQRLRSSRQMPLNEVVRYPS